jgi:hypothetical protein
MYDVVTGDGFGGQERTNSFVAYLIAWRKTADEGKILRKVTNKHASIEVALSQLNKGLEMDVAMVMEGKNKGDTIGKGELANFAQKRMQG